jgi:hypothetical protein
VQEVLETEEGKGCEVVDGEFETAGQGYEQGRALLRNVVIISFLLSSPIAEKGAYSL